MSGGYQSDCIELLARLTHSLPTARIAAEGRMSITGNAFSGFSLLVSLVRLYAQSPGAELKIGADTIAQRIGVPVGVRTISAQRLNTPPWQVTVHVYNAAGVPSGD